VEGLVVVECKKGVVMKVVIADEVNVTGDVDGYYGDDLEMDGDLDLSFLDDGKDEPRDDSRDE
jgi:hypothetical protein